MTDLLMLLVDDADTLRTTRPHWVHMDRDDLGELEESTVRDPLARLPALPPCDEDAPTTTTARARAAAPPPEELDTKPYRPVIVRPRSGRTLEPRRRASRNA